MIIPILFTLSNSYMYVPILIHNLGVYPAEIYMSDGCYFYGIIISLASFIESLFLVLSVGVDSKLRL